MEILSSKQNGILTIEFNRPEKKNALTQSMYQALADAVRDGENDPAVRVILFRGKDDIFTAGNELDDFLKATTPDVITERPVGQFMRNLAGATKPVVAAVAGNAVGIGSTMLLHCDLVYAAENAKFAMPFVPLGVCPEFASSLLLQQAVGYQRAAPMLLLGEAITAAEAFQIGLVSKVLPVAELIGFATAQAAKLAALPAPSLRATKALMKEAQKEAIAARMAAENKRFSAMLVEPPAKEAFAAFFEKRKPDFSKFS
jgi:enoyl-CoA hydratase/carnithine racemase